MNIFNKLKEHDVDITGLKMPNAFEMRKKQFEELYYWSITGTYSAKLSLRHAIVDRDPTNDLTCDSVLSISAGRTICSKWTRSFTHPKIDEGISS